MRCRHTLGDRSRHGNADLAGDSAIDRPHPVDEEHPGAIVGSIERVGVVAAVLVAGSDKAAAHRVGLSHTTVKHHLANARTKVGAATTAQLVWILAPRPPEPEDTADTG